VRAIFSTMKFWASIFIFSIATFFATRSSAQTTNYSQGGLQVNVFTSNPCNGSSNGFVRFTVTNTSDGLPATLQLIIGPVSYFSPTAIPVGGNFTFNSSTFPSNPPASLSSGSYDFILRDNAGVDVINTFSSGIHVVLTALPAIAINEVTRTSNSNCASPDGVVIASVTGGSKTPALTAPGSFTFTWTSSNGLAGLPLIGTFDGTSNLNLATQLSLGGLPGGTYSINIQDNYSSCSQSRSFIISDPSPSLFSITSGSGTACSGSNFTVTLNGSDGAIPVPGANYEILRNGSSTGLFFPGTGAAPFNMNFPTAGFTNGDVLTVRSTNGFCTPRLMTGSVVLNIASSPTAAVLSGTTTICSGLSANLSVAITGGTAPFSFTITGIGLVTGYASGAPIFVSPGTTTIYTLSGSVTDANGCPVAGSGAASVTVNPVPTAGISSLPSGLCAGNSSTLTFGLTGSGPFNVGFTDGFSTFNLSGISNGHTVVVSPPTTRTYTITSITDATSCIGIAGANTTITVSLPPTAATLTGAATICAGQSTDLSVAITGGTPPYSFTITGLGAIGAYISGSSISVSPAITTNYTLTGIVLDANGCNVTGTGSALVTVNPLPVATISSLPGVLCTGGSSTLTFTLTGTAPFNVSYTDGASTFALVGISTGHTVAVNPVATTSYTITNVSDATICVGVAGSATTVTVNSSPTSATLSGNATICAGQSTNLSVAIVGGTGPFSFTITGLGLVSGYTSGDPIPVSPLANTIYTLSGSVTDANGCPVAGSGSASVIVNPIPVATVNSSPAILCGGGSSTLTFTLTGTAPFNVDYSDGVTTFNLVGISTGHTVVVTPASTTTYTITAVTDATTCIGASGSATTVTVNPPIASATLSGSATICAGQSTNLAVNIVGGTAPFSFTITGLPAITGYSSNDPISVSPASTTNFTISGVITDANGCNVAGLGSALVTVNPIPTATISGGGAVCSGNPLPNVIFTFTGTAPFDFTWSDGVTPTTVVGHPSTTFSIANAPAGTYSISSLTDATICPATSLGTPVSVVVSSAIVSATLSGTTAICSSQTANLSVTIIGGLAPYSFTIPGIAPISGYTSGDPISVSPVSSITFTLSGLVTDANGCTVVGTGSAVITVNPTPDATITAAGPFCTSDAAINLVAATAGGTWNGVGITNTLLGTFDPSVAGAGTFTISYTVTSLGCPDTKTTSITVANPPDATITPAGPFCATDLPTNLTAATAGGTWSGTGITNAALGTFDPAIAGAGSFTITYSVTVGGCSDSKTTSITVNPAPDATITAAGPFCATDLATNLTAATAGGTWSGTGITNAALGTFDPAIAGAGSFTITYSVTVGGCSDSKTTSITVNPAPDATITAAGPFCATDLATNLTAATAGGTWSGTGITNAALGTFDPATAGTGSFTITYSVTVGGCSDSKTTSITVNPAPDATITAAGPFCITDAAVTLSAATLGGTWSGTGITNAATGAFDPATAGVGSFTISYTVTSLGCTDIKTTSITVANPPNATITPAGPFCTNGATANLTAATPGGTWSGTGITNAATGTFDPAIAGVGSFTITYSITIGGCNDSKTTSITVNSAPNATIATAGPFCTSDTATNLTAATLGGTWSGPGITNAAAGTFDPSTAGAGTFTISYSVTSSGCTDTKTTSITVANPPNATITPAGPFCDNGAAITLSAVTSGGTWSGTGITNAATGTFNPTTSGAGTFTITYSITIGGCSDSKTTSITVNVAPVVTINPAGSLCTTSSSITLNASAAGGTWSGTGITNSATGAFNPAVSGAGSFLISYSVTVGGCTVSATRTIVVDAICGGGGTNCFVFTITVDPLLTKRPSCSNQNDGKIVLNVSGVTAGNYIISLLDKATGIAVQPPQIGTSGVYTFSSLSPNDYSYKVQDVASNVCQQDFTLLVNSTVTATADPLSFVDATCFGKPNGQAKLTITGGNSPYEYSVDGGATFTKGLVSGNIIGNLPPNGTYNILVRDDATDLCPATASVTINNTNPVITATAPTITDATCANNDGSITIGSIAGGAGVPYTFRFDSVSYNALPALNKFPSLSGGVHKFTVIDKIGCEKYFSYVVNFPGFASTTALTIVQPDCVGSGINGSIQFTITSPGSFTVGYTTDLTALPTNFFDPGGLNVSISGLKNGDYFVWVKPNSAACATKLQPIQKVRGAYPVTFTDSLSTIKCFGEGASIILKNIKGAPNLDFTYDLIKSGVTTTNAITYAESLGSFTIPNLTSGNYQLQLKQIQSAINPLCTSPVTTSIVSFKIDEPFASLDTLYVQRRVSLPDLPTGTMLIGISESGKSPYLVEVELLNSNETSYLKNIAATQNKNNLKLEANFTNMPAGDYQITITDGYGCSKVILLKIEKDQNIFIPNVFTPNNDGSNDEFYIRNLPENSTVSIASRWGGEVYSSSNYKNDWNGGSNADGIYYYRISAGGSVFTGWVEIIRGK
jgi:large repetitive protein